ncbi:hypothetical protein [uncultured Hymenobacter sp.]|uniref:hypothetical protein n=1 Tax=uncultured Hymenobacter sp. TaxID=170016 RepID=UPI0035CABA47
MNTPNNLTSEQAHYRETAEYGITVAAAQRAAGRVQPDDCLAYGLRCYLAAYPHPYFPPVEREPPEVVPEKHPDYPRLLAGHRRHAEQQLQRAYRLRREDLAAELAAARDNNPPDPPLALALLLKKSAERLLEDRDYLTRVGSGLPPVFAKQHHAQLAYAFTPDKGRYKGIVTAFNAEGCTAAELEHFRELLAEFHRVEAPTIATPNPADDYYSNLGMSELNKNISDLCLFPFTKSDLISLLQHLELLDYEGNNQTLHLGGRNREVWGKFTAAYRVLSRLQLMKSTSDDKVWATAFKTSFKVVLGHNLRERRLLAAGGASDEDPKQFRQGVEDATHWVKSWITWRGKAKERPTMPFIVP